MNAVETRERDEVFGIGGALRTLPLGNRLARKAQPVRQRLLTVSFCAPELCQALRNLHIHTDPNPPGPASRTHTLLLCGAVGHTVAGARAIMPASLVGISRNLWLHTV